MDRHTREKVAGELVKLANDLTASRDLDLIDYDLQEQIGKIIDGQKIGRWRASWVHPGFISWTHTDLGSNTFEVAATPWWDGKGSIQVDVNLGGENLDAFDIPFESSGDASTDARNYLSLMKKVWKRIRQALIKTL
jgi:hypothetical protein